MIHKLKVENGIIKLPPELNLPDGAEVQLTIPDDPDQRPFGERYASYIGVADDLPSDLAENHDRYAQGQDAP
jgi:hypothetical protein